MKKTKIKKHSHSINNFISVSVFKILTIIRFIILWRLFHNNTVNKNYSNE